ncbi:hypothetical protein GOBAR_AA37896 [Gossypium barbadense]|uniref:DUF7745 domain-containing protein n=1 Tax=Gossypium barbadense TaxID=3634 RepID=A0A2P5VVH5_GOSBA|nr:hypothetical protein GOBAR_AA37896 [Gossypium barbadense]
MDMVLTIKEYSTLLHYDFRDPLRIYWKRNVDFRGPLGNLMELPVDMVKARLKDKNGPCISWFDIMDAMGKASGDRHLSLFAFSVYGLIVFPKAVGFVSVELADFLFQIKKRMNPAPAILAKTIISLNFIRRKGDGCFLECAQLLFIWMKSYFRCLYKRFRQLFFPSTRPIEEFLESSLNWHIGSHQLFLADSSEPKTEPEILEEIGRDTNQVGSNIDLAIRNLFHPFPFENVYLVAPKKKQNLHVSVIQEK